MSLVTDILRKNRTFAVVGVSQDPAKYGHEIFETLLDKGYRALPVNPKYEQVDGHPCYPSLEALPEKPEVVVAVVPPAVTETVVETAARLGVRTVWMPPGAWSDRAVELCEQAGITEVHDVCLVFALRSLKE
ncbi:MAG: CoA-binding protein [Anaerolineales bacterium]